MARNSVFFSQGLDKSVIFQVEAKAVWPDGYGYADDKQDQQEGEDAEEVLNGGGERVICRVIIVCVDKFKSNLL